MSDTKVDAEVLIVGAGMAGIYMLYKARQAGMSVRLLEEGDGVGGTWFWNKYPNARVDAEIYTYAYFFSRELFDGWQWSEHFAGQPEIERYMNYVVDRCGIRDAIQFGVRVESAEFDDASRTWVVGGADGTVVRARYLVTAVGNLSAPFVPDIAGRGDYRGELYHTSRWPAEPVNFKGKRVAVIGTGSSGVQIIPAIADEVASLVVYQRTPNWCTPLNNRPISSAEQEQLREGFADLYETLRSTSSGHLHVDATRGTFEVSQSERRAHYEQVWQTPGFASLFSNFADLMTDPAANAEFSEFIAEKIRARVADRELAEKLIPKDHGYGTKRPPLENGFFETFNRPNVSLISLRETPITGMTAQGIVTSEGERQFDIVVFATGFDAVTGALFNMNVKGAGGRVLREFWEDGPRTYLGIQAPGFPNLLMINGPHSVYGNVPRCTEVQVDFVAGLLEHLRARGYDHVECSEDAEELWTAHAYEAAAKFLTADNAWYLGTNIPGKPRRFLLYVGGLTTYRAKLDEVARDYDGFVMTRSGENELSTV